MNITENTRMIWYLYDSNGNLVNTFTTRANARAAKGNLQGSYLAYRQLGPLTNDKKS